MALKDDVQVAKLETIKELHTELRNEIELVVSQLAHVQEISERALGQTDNLNSRLASVEKQVVRIDELEKHGVQPADKKRFESLERQIRMLQKKC